MVRSLKEILESQGYGNIFLRFFVSLIIVSLILIMVVAYFLFFTTKACGDEQCFVNSFNKCEKNSLIKESSQASLMYQIVGSSEKGICKVKVTLLRLKEGTIQNEELQGKSMYCLVQKSDALNAEDDLSRCTGILKEQMQDIMIQRMHNDLLQNLNQVEESAG